MSLAFVHCCFLAAPHVRKKPSLPNKPSAEGQTRQIYRQSRDDDRFEFCSHLVSMNDPKILAKFNGSGDIVGIALPFLSSTCTKHVYPDLWVCRHVRRNQTDEHSLYTRANSIPVLERVVGLLQCVGWRVWGLSTGQGVSQVSRGMCPEQIRDGERPCHCPRLWHRNSASCKN